MPVRMRFSYWSDPLCIWALVAQKKLDRVLAELGEHVHVEYRVVPVFGSERRVLEAGDALVLLGASHGHQGRVRGRRGTQ